MSNGSLAVDIESFLHCAQGPIFDVRSPCEFSSGHIPGSYSLPLFSDSAAIENHSIPQLLPKK